MLITCSQHFSNYLMNKEIYNADINDLAAPMKNDVTCLLATQFVMNEGADQTPIETYFV